MREEGVFLKIILAAGTQHRLRQIFLLSLREFSERMQMSGDSKVGFHKGLLLRKHRRGASYGIIDEITDGTT